MGSGSSKDVLFSVVIPAYNRAKTIQRAIYSVLRQTYQKFEIIVVDDGSTDDTRTVVLTMKDKRIRYIYQDNQGAQVARNRGIIEAKHEWIAFLDSDDEWVPQKLEWQYEAMQKEGFNPFLVIGGDSIVKDTQESREYCWKGTDLSKNDILALPSYSVNFSWMVTSKTVLRKIGLLDTNVTAYQEWDTSVSLAKFCKFIVVHKPLAVYYRYTGDTISNNHLRDVAGYEYIIRKWKSEILSRCGEDVWNYHLVTICDRCIRFGFWERADKIFFERYGKPLQYDLLVQDVRERIQDSKTIYYCYGAGKVGSLVKHFLESIEIRIRYFLVSPGEPTGVHEGIPVHSIEDIDNTEHCTIIISTREKLHSAILTILETYKFNNVYPITDERYLLMSAFLAFGKRADDAL